jgi:hypothetical protein
MKAYLLLSAPELSRPLPRAPRGATASLLLSVWAMAASLALVACGSSDPAPAPVTPSGDDPSVPAAVSQIFRSTDFQKGCGNASGCHLGFNDAAKLDLTTDGVKGRLLDVVAIHPMTTGCATGDKLIDSSVKANSFLLKKIKGTQASGCGLAMPFGTSGLPAAEVTTIQTWIDSL